MRMRMRMSGRQFDLDWTLIIFFLFLETMIITNESRYKEGVVYGYGHARRRIERKEQGVSE